MSEVRLVRSHGKLIRVSTLNPNPANKGPRQQKQQKHTDRFVKVPLTWAERCAKATGTGQAYVWIWLLHRSWEEKSKTFPLPNGRLHQVGVSRDVKRRALAKLEAAGLIKVERPLCKTPIVTLCF
jgi:hypothetical protein